LILVDDRLVVFGAQGVVAVAAATPKGYDEELRGQFLEHSSFTWPSFANGHIFVRNSSELVCIQVVQADTAVAVAGAPQPVGQGAFGRFVQSVTRAEDKTALVDAFFAGQKSFPIVEDNTVHVVYRGDVEDVAIAGTMLDDARPRGLQRVEGTNFYYRSYPIEPGARWEYGLEVDFGEPTPDPLNPRTAFGIIYDLVGNPRYEGPLSEVVMPGYDSATHLREPEGARGRIETYEFESVALGNKRSIKVYLPVGYGDSEAEYPLLIVHRGPEWLEKGKMTHSLDNLIGTRVQPVVVAFVPPGPIWWSEGTGTGTDKYLAMLVEEFVPDIERRYRLSSRPQDRALIGANWFGLTAAYGVILFPDVFGKAGVQSAGLGEEISVHDFFERLHSRPANDAVFYVDWNRYEMRVPDQSWDQRADGRRLSSELRKQGYKVLGGEALDTHGWTSWRARTDDLLVALFPLD
jgi:enterochelin esterase-like enzyme